MANLPPFVTLVRASHRRLAQSPVYSGHLFPVDRFFPQPSSPSSPPPPPQTVTLPLLTSEINALSTFYQLRCSALTATVNSLHVDVPSPDSPHSLAFAFACLLRQHSRDLYTATIDDALRERVDASFAAHIPAISPSSPSTDAATAIALKADGVTADSLAQLRRVMDAVVEVDQLRSFCLTASMQAAAALALLSPPLSTPSPLLSSPFALSHHLTDLNTTLQGVLDGFLPRVTASSVCPLSSLTIALPVTLSCCSHRFELLSVLTSGASSITADRRCPLCSRAIDAEVDQLTVDSTLLKLEDKAAKDELVTIDVPQPVPSPALTLSSMSNGAGDKVQVTVRESAFHPASVQARGIMLPAEYAKLAMSEEELDERGVSCHQVSGGCTHPSSLFRASWRSHVLTLLCWCAVSVQVEQAEESVGVLHDQGGRAGQEAEVSQEILSAATHTSTALLLPAPSTRAVTLWSLTGVPSLSPSSRAGDACLRRSYNQCITSMTEDDLLRWVCPSCSASCSCAACLRRGNRSSSSEFTSPSSTAASSPQSTPTHTPTPSQPPSTQPSPSARKPPPPHPTPAPTLPPTLMQGQYPLAMSGLPTPLRPMGPVSLPFSTPFNPFHFHRPGFPPNAISTNPFGGYQFAVSPQFVMSGGVGGGMGMGQGQGGGGLVVTGMRNGHTAAAQMTSHAPALLAPAAAPMAVNGVGEKGKPAAATHAGSGAASEAPGSAPPAAPPATAAAATTDGGSNGTASNGERVAVAS